MPEANPLKPAEITIWLEWLPKMEAQRVAIRILLSDPTYQGIFKETARQLAQTEERNIPPLIAASFVLQQFQPLPTYYADPYLKAMMTNAARGAEYLFEAYNPGEDINVELEKVKTKMQRNLEHPNYVNKRLAIQTVVRGAQIAAVLYKELLPKFEELLTGETQAETDPAPR